MNDIPQSIEQVFQILLEKGIVTAVEKRGIEQKYSQLIEQNEKVDNTLGQLGYSYIDKYIAREVL